MQEEESKQLVVPPEPGKDVPQDQVVTIQLRCPDGSRLLRRFLKTTTHVQDIINYYRVEKKLGLQSEVMIMTTFPKRALEDATKTLLELGFGK